MRIKFVDMNLIRSSFLVFRTQFYIQLVVLSLSCLPGVAPRASRPFKIDWYMRIWLIWTKVTNHSPGIITKGAAADFYVLVASLLWAAVYVILGYSIHIKHIDRHMLETLPYAVDATSVWF